MAPGNNTRVTGKKSPKGKPPKKNQPGNPQVRQSLRLPSHSRRKKGVEIRTLIIRHTAQELEGPQAVCGLLCVLWGFLYSSWPRPCHSICPVYSPHHEEPSLYHEHHWLPLYCVIEDEPGWYRIFII